LNLVDVAHRGLDCFDLITCARRVWLRLAPPYLHVRGSCLVGFFWVALLVLPC
jgi:hypothetical protein